MSQFPLFETIAIKDGIAQNIAYHQARYEKSCFGYFNETPLFELSKILTIPQEYKQGLYRCKIAYNQHDYEIQYFPYQAKELHYFDVVYSDNLDYQFKYSNRSIFQTFPINQHSEVIIINNGKVSDCTIGNLLFSKQGKWYSSKDYLLKGTQLSRLLDEKQVELLDIPVESLGNFEQIMLINALNPFDLARALPIQAVRFA
ncbi:Branched-chain amino acid aminotransferase/4-amino-4-deoxychorismate lyase [Bibersteinia trehalosi USDA-ARS-USMARC-188]|uniref:Branched-chain amino acid aminotransferase/4-amino-4-deoxychorismate lyase n=4 Tax=Bibersteinia trehalosi TaxID=47735 RepID=W0R963_BIBTR|nr:aminotransferase class IV family protein [Bibersteinia trehalosi]AGH39054.1 Branched-chain amino acid aminotransferase/4-amino-4-deoxychorismate lyase [Bibersteinia trehalosi USDA-ARS-USMARC-192]AHG81198.1 Branched-chain amino acid aminotransferase/4-amino-4-deoxychorismate lyase [Bibersteinia trehalosi USDA-ARS-USMARC-188]AHG83412.1 Branched-chain amino acid aminotransferase/4-amino-4-deoxychorismate lyase [Bibersteinia trehalosi USDA-ARS-USMARC-189]AHG86992.1 Branched-chain amino acid amin